MRILALLSVILVLNACYYDVEEELYPDTECTTDNMSYNDDILPIIQLNCYACHDQRNQLAGVILEGHAALKTYVDNGKLLGVIRHDPGFPPMPNGAPKLRSCDIEKIESWVNDGAMNN